MSADKVLSLDIETTGLGWKDKVLVVAAAWREEGEIKTDSLNVGMRDLFNTPATIPEARAWLQGHLRDKVWAVFHSGSFDIPYLVRSQLLDLDQLEGRVFDTLVMARCTAPHDSVSLINLCEEYRIVTNGEWKAMKGRRSKLADSNPEWVKEYAELDAKNTSLLFEKIYPLATEQYDEPWIKEEGEFARLMAKIRLRGIPLNLDRVSNLIADRARKGNLISKYLLERWRLGSASDRNRLIGILSEAGFTLPKTEKGNPSLNESSLNGLLEHWGMETRCKRLINAVLKGRHWQKEISTWLEGMLNEADDVGRVHPNFSVGGTMSSRLSCSNPNAQAVPGDLDIWDPGLTEADYGQAELRMAALFAKEDGFARILADPLADIHEETAKLMFSPYDRTRHRPVGKSCNFATIYGGGKRKLAEAFDITEEKAASLLKRHRKAFPAFPRAIRQAERVWLERGYLRLAHGKRLYANGEDKLRAYKAFNNVVQGSVAEILKKAMLEIDRHIPEARIVNQVHDSLVLEMGPGADREAVTAAVREAMVGAVPAELRGRTTPPIEMAVDFKGG